MGADSVELRELRVFLMLADELHFGRSAERLGLTAPRVSQTIATLERRVGGRLFDRTSRRVTLTERGVRLCDDVAGPYADLETAVAAAADTDADVAGELRLGLFGPASGGPRLPEIIAEFERRHPGATVQISEVPLTDCLGPLCRREIDLLATCTVADSPDLTVGPVLSVDDRVLLVATDHPLAGCYDVSIEVLGDYLVAKPVGWSPAMEKSISPRHTPSGRPIVRAAVKVASVAAIHAAVIRGEIVHLSAASTRYYSSHPGIVFVPVPDAPPVESFLVRRGDDARARVAAFVAVAEEVLDVAPASHPGPATAPPAVAPVDRGAVAGDPVELRELRAFLVLAEELHFGRTAERLALTPPRVSQTIATLERRIGGRLFDRTSRRVRPTERGTRLRDGVSGPFAALCAAVAPSADVRGRLRLGLFGPASGGPRLPEIVAEFERRHPDATVQIDEVALPDCLAALRCGEIDLLATRTVVDAPDLVIGPILHVDERVLLIATDHPLAEYDQVSVEVLGDHPVARPVGWSPEMEQTVIPLRTPTGRPVVRAIEVTSMAATYAAVARGDIVHLSTAVTRQYSGHPGVTHVRVPDAPPSASVLVWRRVRDDEPLIGAFVDVAFAVDTAAVG